MGSEKWQQLKDVVGTVLEHKRQEWPICLVDECGHDVDLFLEASTLLATSAAVGEFIEKPAWHVLSRQSAVPNSSSGGGMDAP